MQQSLRTKYNEQKKLQEGVRQGSLSDMKVAIPACTRSLWFITVCHDSSRFVMQTFLLHYDSYESIRDSAELVCHPRHALALAFTKRATFSTLGC